MAIITKADLKAYIIRQLGGGVNNIELTDDQLEDAIENAIGYYEREVDGGVEDRIYLLESVEGVQEYILDAEVMGVSEVFSTGVTRTTDILSTLNQFRLDVAQPLTQAGYAVSGYVANMQYLSFINQFLANDTIFNFNPVTKKLVVHQTVTSASVIAMVVLWSTRNSQEMWNNNFIKEYSTALSMKQWGINMSKFAGAQLLGGMELNGSQMIDIADAEITRLREELTDKETSPLGIWIG